MGGSKGLVVPVEEEEDGWPDTMIDMDCIERSRRAVMMAECIVGQPGAWKERTEEQTRGRTEEGRRKVLGDEEAQTQIMRQRETTRRQRITNGTRKMRRSGNNAVEGGVGGDRCRL